MQNFFQNPAIMSAFKRRAPDCGGHRRLTATEAALVPTRRRTRLQLSRSRGHVTLTVDIFQIIRH